MKKISALLSFLILFTAFTCENEPLDGDFTEESPISCTEAIQNVTTATANFSEVTPDDENYSQLCIVYRSALQVQIDACGDDDGSMQIIIDSLDNCGLSDCEIAIIETDNAESAYNSNSSNSSLCYTYETALQNQINVCGDADGSIQAIIDGLDCESNSDLVLLKRIEGTYQDGSTFTEIYSYDGNKLISIDYGEGEIETFTYENGLLVRFDEVFENSGGQLEATYTLLEYDSQNRLILETLYDDLNVAYQKWTYSYNADGTITQTSYYITNGNESLGEDLIITITNGNFVFDGGDGYTAEYVFDDKNGVLKNIYATETFILLGYVDGYNNLISETLFYNGIEDQSQGVTIVYTYNSDDYPTTGTYDFDETSGDMMAEFFYE